ncbi:hypothetical protein IBTHAUMO2_360006 [Nitrosopumilaceae archaeon]|nr:hypothetical protein [Nitrosopumilus sp.]CAI9831683.1 hypothetical protein IBTHAUMO2_360006 [Nitrosopumilaceae archaeon]
MQSEVVDIKRDDCGFTYAILRNGERLLIGEGSGIERGDVLIIEDDYARVERCGKTCIDGEIKAKRDKSDLDKHMPDWGF